MLRKQSTCDVLHVHMRWTNWYTHDLENYNIDELEGRGEFLLHAWGGGGIVFTHAKGGCFFFLFKLPTQFLQPTPPPVLYGLSLGEFSLLYTTRDGNHRWPWQIMDRQTMVKPPDGQLRNYCCCYYWCCMDFGRLSWMDHEWPMITSQPSAMICQWCQLPLMVNHGLTINGTLLNHDWPCMVSVLETWLNHWWPWTINGLFAWVLIQTHEMMIWWLFNEWSAL